MDFTTIGSIGMFARTMKMQFQWQEKSRTGNYAAKDSNKTKAEKSEKDVQLDLLTKQLDEMRDNSDDSLQQILIKVRNGAKLTSEELSYLREKYPEEYKKAKEVQDTRKAYEHDLKKCRTKEDFQQLRMLYIGKSMAVVNTVANNPAISGGTKLGLLMQENAKVNAVNEAGYKFVESGKYGRLPTEEELNQEIHEEKEQERADLEERKPDDSTEEMKPDETVREGAKPPETAPAETDRLRTEPEPIVPVNTKKTEPAYPLENAVQFLQSHKPEAVHSADPDFIRAGAAYREIMTEQKSMSEKPEGTWGYKRKA